MEKVNWSDDIDSNGFSMVEVTSMLNDLGYVNPGMQYHYKISYADLDNGLLHLSTDSDVLKLIKHVERYKVIEAYVQHPIDTYVHVGNENVGLNIDNSGLGKDNVDSENDFDPFFSHLDNEMGQSSDMPRVGEPNESDDVVSDHSYDSEASDDSEDSVFDVELENRLMIVR